MTGGGGENKYGRDVRLCAYLLQLKVFSSCSFNFFLCWWVVV